MTTDSYLGLPRDLGAGLVLRWATPEDTEELAAFNVQMHSDDPAEPEEHLRIWTRDLTSGRHPTVGAEDFTVVVDQNDDGRIVSSLNLISQTWTYDGIPFGVGRPELVATHPDYRRRGLVREQMDVVHALSATRGELVTAITGIPWYYRQFGYEMTVELGGGREFFWARHGNDGTVERETYTMRPATVDDIPLLQVMYATHAARSLLVRTRDERLWRWELLEANRETEAALHAHLIEDSEGEALAYVEYRQWGTGFRVRELGVRPGCSWRDVCLFITRELRREAQRLNEGREKPITNISFGFGTTHPVYDALGGQLERQSEPYTWYLRVPDVRAFLRHITPVLESRLAAGPMAGYTGTFRINLYRDAIALVWQDGRLKEIGRYERAQLDDGDMRFPEHTFLHVLFGHRTLEEVRHIYRDCYASKAEATLLTNTLFPKRPSLINYLD